MLQSDDGVWCEGLPTLPSLPMKFPKVFADHTRYIDVFGLKYDLSLVYDSIKDITADGVTKGFAGNFEERLPQDATQVIHDIRRGESSNAHLHSMKSNDNALMLRGETARFDPASRGETAGFDPVGGQVFFSCDGSIISHSMGNIC